jgi:hypothetical protein
MASTQNSICAHPDRTNDTLAKIFDGYIVCIFCAFELTGGIFLALPERSKLVLCGPYPWR